MDAKPRLLDQVRDRLRTLHYSIRTEQQYLFWIRRYMLFSGRRHPVTLGAPDIEAFLTHLAEGRLAPVFDASWAVPVQAHFLVYPARHGKRAEVEAFCHWLTQAATSDTTPGMTQDASALSAPAPLRSPYFTSANFPFSMLITAISIGSTPLCCAQ